MAQTTIQSKQIDVADLEGNIDHNQLTNTHNLTTDIDHNQLTNYVALEHERWDLAGTGSPSDSIHYTRLPFMGANFPILPTYTTAELTGSPVAIAGVSGGVVMVSDPSGSPSADARPAYFSGSTWKFFDETLV